MAGVSLQTHMRFRDVPANRRQLGRDLGNQIFELRAQAHCKQKAGPHPWQGAVRLQYRDSCRLGQRPVWPPWPWDSLAKSAASLVRLGNPSPLPTLYTEPGLPV
jgi:hypothetical protein